MKNLLETGNRIVDLTFGFSLKTIEYVELLEEKRKFVIANQLLKVEHPLVPIFEKHNIVKARQILFISLKWLQKSQKKLNIGYCYVSTQIPILLKRIYLRKSKKFNVSLIALLIQVKPNKDSIRKLAYWHIIKLAH